MKDLKVEESQPAMQQQWYPPSNPYFPPQNPYGQQPSMYWQPPPQHPSQGFPVYPPAMNNGPQQFPNVSQPGFPSNPPPPSFPNKAPGNVPSSVLYRRGITRR